MEHSDNYINTEEGPIEENENKNENQSPKKVEQLQINNTSSNLVISVINPDKANEEVIDKSLTTFLSKLVLRTQKEQSKKLINTKHSISIPQLLSKRASYDLDNQINNELNKFSGESLLNGNFQFEEMAKLSELMKSTKQEETFTEEQARPSPQAQSIDLSEDTFRHSAANHTRVISLVSTRKVKSTKSLYENSTGVPELSFNSYSIEKKIVSQKQAKYPTAIKAGNAQNTRPKKVAISCSKGKNGFGNNKALTLKDSEQQCISNEYDSILEELVNLFGPNLENFDENSCFVN